MSVPAPPKPLIAAVKRLLRPLIRLLIAKGVGLPALMEILKGVYISVAAESFGEPGKTAGDKKITDSRISLLTGVHRKDVKRLRGQPEDAFSPPKSVGIGALAVARWMSSAATTDAQGQPLPLPRQPESAGAPSFDGLIESVSKDVRPRAVLDDWLALGVARLDDQGRVVLNRAAFVPEKGLEEKAFFLGRNVHDHLASAVHNVLGAGNPLMDRSVHYSHLTPASVKTLTDTAERLGMQSLLAINRLALELSDQDKQKTDADQRVNFGLYFYSGPSSLGDRSESDSSK
ncbi:MAG: DUF6502 family protein [Rhodospirillaceae bacterium]|nr:DUF6502 family protein [Rhodospirillaceae bacterium]